MSPIPLLLAAALILPVAHDLAHEIPDPIPDRVLEHRMELALEDLHDTNGPYTVKASTSKTVVSGASAKQRAPRSSLRLKKGHEADTLRWEPLVRRYWGPSDVARALCTISFESGGRADAKSRSGSYQGLFQQAVRYWDSRSSKAGWPGADILNPEANIAVSAWLKNQGGWGHWTITRCR